ncbi:diiron oxygenase [Mycobacterium sp.]|uniref:diiron oxygenase n=1 Tax=Mycobacterium sp. TaxID=1785 RepID=UPI003BAB4763
MTGSSTDFAHRRLRDGLIAMGGVSARLSRLSRNSYRNPYTAVGWPEAVYPERDWFSTPEYLSLYGTSVWDDLAEPTRRLLAFHEAANFYSVNIHSEKSLMQGLAARLYRQDLMDVAGYLHHFLDEENKHSIYFGEFCTRYAQVYRTRRLAEDRDCQPRDVEDFLFFAKAMIFEEIVGQYKWVQSRDARLHPIARFINHNHDGDKSRHLVFGRCLVNVLWEACAPYWGDARISDVRDQLALFFIASWRDYYNPDVFANVGFDDPWQLAEDAWGNAQQRRHRRALSTNCLNFLLSNEILIEEPADAF